MVMSSRAPDSSADFDQKGAWQIDGRGGGEQGGRGSVVYEQLVYQPIIW